MRLGIILLLLNMVFLKQAYAITSTDSTKNTPNNSFNTIGGNCNYYGQDTYNGTELPAAGMSSPYFGTGPSWTTPPLVDSGGMTLAWSGGSSSSLAVPVTCSGKYQVIFTLELQATDSSNTIAVYPCVKTTVLK